MVTKKVYNEKINYLGLYFILSEEQFKLLSITYVLVNQLN